MPRLHRYHWIFSLTLLSLLFVTLVPIQAQAQSAPGTIKGVVRDGESGELLDYANVLLVGSSRGTMSLGGGVFYFNVSPGTYTVRVLYLGYAPKDQTVTVTAGGTLNLEFVLETVIVETLQAFDVEGAEYMVDVNTSIQEHTVSSETFANYAIDSVEEAISRQAGVVFRHGELYVRGGRSGEVTMQIDGVRVDNPLGGNSLSVSTLAVETMSIATGGLDAKYGDALSGVMNIITKEGGEKFEGGVRFLTDDFGRQDRTYTNGDRFEYGFGGPTPVRNLTYYISGDLQFTDTENNSIAHRPETKVQVGGTTLFKFRRRQFNSARGSVKLAYTFNENMKVTGEYTYSTSLVERYAPNWNVAGYRQRILYMPEVIYINMLGAWYMTGRKIAVYYGPWYDNMLQQSRTVIVVDGRNSSNRRVPMPVLEVRSAADNQVYTVMAHAEFDGARYPHSAFSTVADDSSYVEFNSANNNTRSENIGQVGKVVWRHNISESTFYTLRLGLVAFDSRNDVNEKDPWLFNHGGIRSPGVFSGQANIYTFGNDHYTDPLSSYYITTSDNFIYSEEYSRSYSLGFELVSNEWENHLIETGFRVTYNDLERYALVGPAIMRQSRYTGEWSQGANRNVFHTYNPEASWYFQDRWEYEGMVVSPGLRWEMFSPGSAAEIEIDNESVDQNVTMYKTAFMPRLGFAFPITERDGFHFHYGRFVQFPSREYLFASQDPVGNGGILGNPNLQPKTTVQYSAGIVHQFTDHIAGQFSLYSKDIYDLIAATQVVDPQTGATLSRYINKAYASARGIELTLDKRFSNYYAFHFAYTYSYADGVASDTAFGSNPEGLAYLPNQELPLDWDQRHTLNLMVRFADPGVWAMSFDFTYGSGFPWTPADRFAKKVDPMLENSERLPSTYYLGIQLERDINFYGKTLSLQLQGLNVLNQDDVVAPWGGGFTPAMQNGAANGGPWYVTETGKWGNSLLHDADGDGEAEFIPVYDPRTFGQHRLWRLGIGFYF